MPRSCLARVRHVVLAWLIFPFSLWAAAPPSLTRLVPADTGMCLTLEDAATHADLFLAGPLAGRLREFPPLAQWRQNNAPDLKRISSEAGRQLGVELDDVWRRMFGR